MSVSLLGVGFALLATLALAVQSLTVRLGTRTHSVSEVIGVMFAANLLVLLPTVALTTDGAVTLTPRAAAAFAVAGLLGSLAARYAYFIGIVRLGASRAEPLKALFPVFAVGTAVLALDEALTPVLLVGVGLLVAGGVGVAVEAYASPVTASGGRLWTAVAYPLAAALFLGVDPVFTKVGFAEGTPALVGLLVRVLAATAGFAAYVAWRAVRGGESFSLRPNRWLFAAGVANTGYLLAYYAALALVPVSLVAPLLGASTLFVVVGARLFIQGEERVTWRLAAAAVVVVAGAAVVVRG
jgi:drug/metabolite transporter (DMT)-like permease